MSFSPGADTRGRQPANKKKTINVYEIFFKIITLNNFFRNYFKKNDKNKLDSELNNHELLIQMLRLPFKFEFNLTWPKPEKPMTIPITNGMSSFTPSASMKIRLNWIYM